MSHPLQPKHRLLQSIPFVAIEISILLLYGTAMITYFWSKAALLSAGTWDSATLAEVLSFAIILAAAQVFIIIEVRNATKRSLTLLVLRSLLIITYGGLLYRSPVAVVLGILLFAETLAFGRRLGRQVGPQVRH